MAEYKGKLAAYKAEVDRINKARATDLMPKRKGDNDFSDADAILRMAINQAATDKFVASGGKNAKHLDHKTTKQQVGDVLPPPPPHPNAQVSVSPKIDTDVSLERLSSELDGSSMRAQWELNGSSMRAQRELDGSSMRTQ